MRGRGEYGDGMPSFLYFTVIGIVIVERSDFLGCRSHEDEYSSDQVALAAVQ